MNTRTIRGFRDGDAAAIAALNDRIMAEGYSDSGYLILPLTEHQLEAELATGVVNYAVCEVQGSVAAFVKYSTRTLPELQWDGAPIDLSDGIHIEKVGVALELRGLGVGRALYDFISEAHSPEALYSFITVSPCANGASLGFHTSLGFQPLADVPYEMPDGSWFLDRLHVLRSPRDPVSPR